MNRIATDRYFQLLLLLFSALLSSSSLHHSSSLSTPPLRDVYCEESKMCVTLNKDWLMEMWQVESPYQLTLTSTCDHVNLGLVSYAENEDNLTICSNRPMTPAEGCPMSKFENETHVGYYNYVVAKMNSTASVLSEEVAMNSTRRLRWECVYPRIITPAPEQEPGAAITAKNDEETQLSPVTQFLGNRTGEGKFEAAMFLYKDREYQKAYSLSPVLDENSRLRVRVILLLGPLFTRLQLVRCWGTPTIESHYNSKQHHDQRNGPREENSEFVLIDNYCPVPEAASRADVDLISNGEHNYAIWESLIFRFVSSSYLYLHCNVRVCFDNVNCTKSCDKNNEEERSLSKRDLDQKKSADNVIVSLGPIRPASRAMGVDTTAEEVDETEEDSAQRSKAKKVDAPLPANLVQIGLPVTLVLIFSTITCLLFFIYRKVIKSTSLPPPSLSSPLDRHIQITVISSSSSSSTPQSPPSPITSSDQDDVNDL